MKNYIEFKPEYFNGILKVLMLTLLISIASFFITENMLLIWTFTILGFLTILFLNNKNWIKKVTLDFNNKVIITNYPLNFLGAKETQIEFKDIEKVTFFKYMSKTPAHFKIEYKGKKLRFNCNKTELEKVSSNFKSHGIETIYFHKKKEVGFR